MKSAHGRSILVGAIIGILAVGVSFAAFASTLTIEGTANLKGEFDVKFTNVTSADTKATSTLPQNISNGVASFDAVVDLSEPGSKSVITYTVSNLGSIGATLTTPSITCYSDALKQTAVECSDNDFIINASALNTTSLDALATATGTVTVEWNASSTTLPTNTTRYFTVTINANQLAS